MNKYLEVLKTLVLQHPGLFDPAKSLSEVAVVKDLREAIDRLQCPEIQDALTVKRLPGIVKWVAPNGFEIGIALGQDLVRCWGDKRPPNLREGDAVEVDVKRTYYGTTTVVAVHLPAQALASETAATEAAT